MIAQTGGFHAKTQRRKGRGRLNTLPMTLGRLHRHVIHALSFGQSPDPRACEKLDFLLATREDLSKEAWFQSSCKDQEVRADVLAFLYQFFRDFLDIPFGRLRPDDRLVEDIQLWRATWSDWDFDLVENFEDTFETDPFMHPEVEKMRTVMDLLVLLSQTATSGTVTRRRLTNWFWVRKIGTYRRKKRAGV